MLARMWRGAAFSTSQRRLKPRQSATTATACVVLTRFYQEQRLHDASTRALEAAAEHAERKKAAAAEAELRKAAAIEEVLRAPSPTDAALTTFSHTILAAQHSNQSQHRRCTYCHAQSNFPKAHCIPFMLRLRRSAAMLTQVALGAS